MALPMVETLRQKEPSAYITWVCGRGIEDLLKAYGKIDELIPIDEAVLLKGGPFARLRVVLALWAKLLFRRYDLVVTGYADFRYRLLSWTVWAEKRRSFDRKKSRPQPIPGRYFGDEYVRLVTDIDGPSAIQCHIPKIQIPLSKSLQAILVTSKRVKRVALVPGGAKNILRDDAVRRWPLENYKKLGFSFLKEGFQVLVVGAATDAWVSETFQNSKIINLVGKTDLKELVSVFNICDLVVSHDSGPMHVAILAGAPTVALFGPTNPFEKTRKQNRVIWGGAELACRPCYDGRNYADCKNNLCMKSIAVEKVREVSLQMLDAVK
jgi:heptosyltransferase-2